MDWLRVESIIIADITSSERTVRIVKWKLSICITLNMDSKNVTYIYFIHMSYIDIATCF